MPSGLVPTAVWKRRIQVSVQGPKIPSIPTNSASLSDCSWNRITSCTPRTAGSGAALSDQHDKFRPRSRANYSVHCDGLVLLERLNRALRFRTEQTVNGHREVVGAQELLQRPGNVLAPRFTCGHGAI